MTMAAAGLLKLLGSAASPLVRPGGVAANTAADFASMVTKARAGELSSGREVTIADTAKVALTDDQLLRLSVAADRAEAQGATRALVLMDGMALHVDLTTREVTGQVDFTDGGVLTDVDAVVGVPPVKGAGGAKEGESPNAPSILPLPGGGGGSALGNASLLKTLANALTAPTR